MILPSAQETIEGPYRRGGDMVLATHRERDITEKSLHVDSCSLEHRAKTVVLKGIYTE